MKDALEKRKTEGGEALTETADFAPQVFGFAALGVMAAMFALMGFSMTIIIFLVLVGYFVWRAVARTEIGEVRGIFEFYLAANEMLRDDERRWYGFELQDAIRKGQKILGMMPDPPPLVHFALGALNHRAGNFQQAENHFAFLLEDQRADEQNRTTASPELKSYVRILRKLEREPAEAPQTTAAIRALERARRHRAAVLLQESRHKVQESLAAANKNKELPAQSNVTAQEQIKPLLDRLIEEPARQTEQQTTLLENKPQHNGHQQIAPKIDNNQEPPKQPNRPRPKKIEAQKPISEVLRDIYD